MATRSGGGGHAIKVKVVLLGEGCVGKTSIVLRYVENKFNEKHEQTLQASYFQKNLNITGRRITLNIWDTAGQERYHALGPIYYRDSNGAIVVYDITDEDSFKKAKNWVRELRKMLGDSCVLCIVGNKTDLEKKRTVSVGEAEEYAASVGAKHYFTSAKQSRGIQELFLDLGKRLIEKETTVTQTRTLESAPPRRTSQGITVTDDTPTQTDRTNNGGCCG